TLVQPVDLDVHSAGGEPNRPHPGAGPDQLPHRVADRAQILRQADSPPVPGPLARLDLPLQPVSHPSLPSVRAARCQVRTPLPGREPPRAASRSSRTDPRECGIAASAGPTGAPAPSGAALAPPSPARPL